MDDVKIVNLDSPDVASTIDDFIAAGSGTPTITWHNFAILQAENTTDNKVQFQFEIDNLINDYLDILDQLSTKVTMSVQEQHKYFYNPELLAFDLYGSTELDFIILKMNGIIDPKDFDMPTIKLLPKSVLIDVFSDIFNAESDYIDENRRSNGLNALTD